ncbi:MAG: hypothetical protein AAF518_26090 [Spirochaetota bacterium]
MDEDNQIDNFEIQVLQEQQGFLLVKFFKMSQQIERTIQEKAMAILEQYQQSRFLPILYTILKELAINACKANQKRVFFEEKGYDIKNQEEYKIGIREYKKTLSEEMLEQYGKKSKQYGFYCHISLEGQTYTI